MSFAKIPEPIKRSGGLDWKKIDDPEELTLKNLSEKLKESYRHVSKYMNDDKSQLVASSMQLSRIVGRMNSLVYDGAFDGRYVDEDEIMECLGEILYEIALIADELGNDLTDVAEKAMDI